MTAVMIPVFFCACVIDPVIGSCYKGSSEERRSR